MIKEVRVYVPDGSRNTYTSTSKHGFFVRYGDYLTINETEETDNIFGSSKVIRGDLVAIYAPGQWTKVVVEE